MTEISREDLQRALDFITTWKLELSMMGVYNDDVKVEPTIRQVLEDRLNQPTVADNASVDDYDELKLSNEIEMLNKQKQTDWKSIADNLYIALNQLKIEFECLEKTIKQNQEYIKYYKSKYEAMRGDN